MASKWAHLRGKLPPLEDAEPEWRAKVDAAKGQYTGFELKDLSRQFDIMRSRKDLAEAEAKSYSADLEALSELLVEELGAQSLHSVHTESGKTIYVSIEPYTSVEDRDKVFAFIKKHKMQQLLSVHWATLNSITKERLQNGESAIPGTKVYLKTQARIRGRNNDSE